MSEEIRKYKASTEWNDESKEMSLTAFVGGDERGSSIQFTVGDNYITLSESQLMDLIAVIALRLSCRDGYTATGESEGLTVKPNGDFDE